MHFFVQNGDELYLAPTVVIGVETTVGRAAIQTWHKDIQKPFIDANANTKDARADCGWNWPRNVPWIERVIQLTGERPFGFVFVVRNPDGKPVPAAITVGIRPFPCVAFADGESPTDAFVWYVTGIPSTAAVHFGLPGLSATAQAVAYCKDIARSIAGEAQIVLHADPKGLSLLRFYSEKCNMVNLPLDAIVRAPLSRRNDGRFFRSQDAT